MAEKQTANPLKVNFNTLPATFRRTAKRIVWALINERTPLDDLERPTAIRNRLAAGTIDGMFHDLRMFLRWLDSRGIERLRDVTAPDLREYAHTVAGRRVVRGVKGRLLFSVTRVWLISPFLPFDDQMIRPTWEDPAIDGDRLEDVIGPPDWTGENKTPPIHPQTMSALLVAALRVIEVFGPDILAAIADKAAMVRATPPGLSLADHDIVEAYRRELVSTGGCLPGAPLRPAGGRDGTGLARSYLAAKLGVGDFALEALRSTGLEIRRGAPLPTPITGAHDGQRWCHAIDFYDVERLSRMLMVACFITTCYLSGMRVEECRALGRHSCRPVRSTSAAPPHYEIHGRSFKDAIDREGNAIPGGVEREQPWLVLGTVARAIATAESLHGSTFVFADGCFKTFQRTAQGPVRPAAARSGIADFVTWWNAFCASSGRVDETIPPDPDGEIAPARFRRTLAWFIYRVPGGRIALGVQYGHLRGYTSDAYGSRVASGLRDVFPMEEALAVAETLQKAGERLDAGEQVSGPAARRYLAGVTAFQQSFEGSYLTPRQMSAMRRNPEMRIYDSPERALACVYDESKALCHPDRDRRQDLSKTPDMNRCRDNCGNIARTDSHARLLTAEIERLREEVESPLTPEPIRDRLAARIARREQELQAHADGRSER
jgi:hypothetical protein